MDLEQKIYNSRIVELETTCANLGAKCTSLEATCTELTNNVEVLASLCVKTAFIASRVPRPSIIPQNPIILRTLGKIFAEVDYVPLIDSRSYDLADDAIRLGFVNSMLIDGEHMFFHILRRAESVVHEWSPDPEFVYTLPDPGVYNIGRLSRMISNGLDLTLKSEYGESMRDALERTIRTIKRNVGTFWFRRYIHSLPEQLDVVWSVLWDHLHPNDKEDAHVD